MGLCMLTCLSVGIGMFVCTYIYMITWVYTGEVNAKRIRERYFRSVLRQDLAYFDNVGAGEITTRIQGDTRASSNPSALMDSIDRFCRPDSARNFGKSRSYRQLLVFVRRGLRGRVRPLMAPGSGDDIYPPVHDHCHLAIWQVHRQVRHDVAPVWCRERKPRRGSHLDRPYRPGVWHPVRFVELVRRACAEESRRGNTDGDVVGCLPLLLDIPHVCRVCAGLQLWHDTHQSRRR